MANEKISEMASVTTNQLTDVVPVLQSGNKRTTLQKVRDLFKSFFDTIYESSANKGAANGYAPLDGSQKVPSANLPSYVDDVVEVANYTALPSPGEIGKIYLTLDTNYEYRWGGSVYIQITNGLIASTADVPESNNKRYIKNSITGWVDNTGTGNNAPFDPNTVTLKALANYVVAMELAMKSQGLISV